MNTLFIVIENLIVGSINERPRPFYIFLFINLIDIVDFIYNCNLFIEILFFRAQNYFGNVFIDMLILICFYLKVIEIKDAGHLEICRFGFALTPVID